MGKVRIVSFQTEDVIEILNREGMYRSCLGKSRERRNYSKDIEQLKGGVPIWGFSPINVTLFNESVFTKEDFLNGCLFERFRCEMSLPYRQDMNKLIMIELEKDACDLRVGLTHNAYKGSVVFFTLNISEVKAVYKVMYTQQDTFYPEVSVLYKKDDSVIFTSNLKCSEQSIEKYWRIGEGK